MPVVHRTLVRLPRSSVWHDVGAHRLLPGRRIPECEDVQRVPPPPVERLTEVQVSMDVDVVLLWNPATVMSPLYGKDMI